MNIRIKVLVFLAILGWGAQIVAQESAESPPAASIVISSDETKVYPLTFFHRVIWAGNTLLDLGDARTPFLLYSYRICMNVSAEDSQDEGCLSDRKITAALNTVAKYKEVRAAILHLSTNEAHEAQGIAVDYLASLSDSDNMQALQTEWHKVLSEISQNGNRASIGTAIAFARPLKSRDTLLTAEKFIAPQSLWLSFAED